MKRTLIEKIPDIALPREVEMLVSGAAVYDSSCSPEARVYYIERDGGYYLKHATTGTLAREAEMTAYFHSLGLGAEVLHYSSGEQDIMLTRRVAGEDCTNEKYLAEPKRLTEILATELRKLHEIRYTGCPVQDRTREYLALADENYRTGNYDASHFPDSFGYRSAEEAWAVLRDGRDALRTDTLLHGDYCLPNVMLDDWSLSGFIDVGCGGVGDRHVDLFWGAWTLWFNLGTDKYRERFYDAYGRDKLDEDIIKVVAAAEVFG